MSQLFDFCRTNVIGGIRQLSAFDDIEYRIGKGAGKLLTGFLCRRTV
jgi:hypothetical protein